MKLGILSGLKVLDLSRMLSGPYCTMMLADHGAEVIKIESPSGDTSRGTGPFRSNDLEKEWSGYFVSLNRNKKSLVINLKTPEGKKELLALVEKSDVLVENFRPGVMDKMGLGYTDLRSVNEKLVYAAISGFGSPCSGASPYSHWPSYDVVAQAMGGLIGITGLDETSPTKVGPGIGDIFSGLMMAFGIMAAVRESEKTSKGQFIDLAMYDAVISLCERIIYQYDLDGSIPKPQGNGHPLLVPFGIFKAKDGFIALGIVDDSFWKVLTDIMGKPDLSSNPDYASISDRQKNSHSLNVIVENWTSLKTKSELRKLLGGLVPFGPVNSAKDIFNDPHVVKRSMIEKIQHANSGERPWHVAGNPLNFSRFPKQKFSAPPRLGSTKAKDIYEDNQSTLSKNTKNRLRSAFGTFATGVTVVTTKQEDGTPRGFTANSFSSVSLDPPMLLVCLAKTAQSFEVFRDASFFVVNILSEKQRAVAGLFSSQRPDKFDLTEWTKGLQDLPVLDSCLSHFVCQKTNFQEVGDHAIMIGEIEEFSEALGNPLGYFRGDYFSVGLEHSIVDMVRKETNTTVGAILENDRQILFIENEDGKLSLPKAPNNTKSLKGLKDYLKTLNLEFKLDFLYSVYEDQKLNFHMIFYHGKFSGKGSNKTVILSLEEIPIKNILNLAERTMIERYCEEYHHGRFGIYQGTDTEGVVKKIL